MDTGKIEVIADLKLKTGATINEFSTDGTLAGDSNTVVPTEGAVKTYVDGEVANSALVITNQQNIVLNAFRIAINGSLTQFNMVDGIVDEYEDESGIDIGASTNESYDSANDLYSPSKDSITTSPFAHYKCNDNAGNTTVTDDGTGANTGTANVNTSNYSVAGQGGALNMAFEFNGTTEFINLDLLEQDIDSDTTGTFAFWFYSGALDATRRMFALGDTSAPGAFFLISVRSSVNQELEVNFNDGSISQFRHTSSISNNTWYHVAVVQDGISVKVYLDGVDITNLTTSNDTGFWFSDEESFLDNGRLGCQNNAGVGNNAFFDGIIDDFRYYSGVVLTEADINLIYNSGTGTEDDQPEGASQNMTLISDSFTAEAEADTSRIVLFEEDVDSITLNTDLKAYASRDGGTTFTQITLVNEGEYESGKNILSASVDISGQPTGTAMQYKIETLNNKDLKIHGTGLSWD